MVTLLVPDLISPSYFPAIAAAQLGCIERHGVDVDLRLHFPVTSAVDALRRGDVEFVAGTAHAIFDPTATDAVRLLASLSQHTYWFLVVRSDLEVPEHFPLRVLQGLHIGAAPGPADALVQMLVDAGVEGVEVTPVPGTSANDISFGVSAAKALALGMIDGFWANGMGAEVAVRDGVGSVIVDARRRGGPPGSELYTFPALMTSARFDERETEVARGVVAGIVEAQELLRRDPNLATEVARDLFPPAETELIAELISRDVPFYEAEIVEGTVNHLSEFARNRGLLAGPCSVDDIVSRQTRDLWPNPRAASA